MSIDKPPVTPQQYEVLHGGGAEAAEIAKQRFSRRRFLRRSMLAIWGIAAVGSVAGTLDLLYPNLAGQFGASLDVGNKSVFKAATPDTFVVNQAGVFYRQQAKTYVVHLAKDTHFLLHGTNLSDQWTPRPSSRMRMARTGLRCTNAAFTWAALCPSATTV